MGIISSAMLHSWEEMGCLDNDNNEELEQLKAENNKLRTCLQEIKRVLCEGRTFYDGYFDNPESLSRIDKAIYLITKVESEG